MNLPSPRSDRSQPIAVESVDGRSATPLVIGMALLALGVVGYFALGMPGMDHSTSSNHDTPAHRSHRVVAPSAFEAAVLDPATVTINVHVPAEEIGIEGTDLVLQFDQLDPATLPPDRATPLAIYCRSGAMSAIAAQRLVALGYTDIAELAGGTDAWEESGRAMTNSDGA